MATTTLSLMIFAISRLVVALPSVPSVDERYTANSPIRHAPSQKVQELSVLPKEPLTVRRRIHGELDGYASEANIDSSLSNNAIHKQLSAAFPGGTRSGLPRWSTDPSVRGAIPLSDHSLGAIKVISRLPHPVVTHAGKKAMKVSFTRGSYGLGSPAPGGMSMYALGPYTQPMHNAKVITLSYSVQFSPGFEFNLGGKLPGLYGGTSNGVATGCSGGRTSNTCWSTRFMWRTNGRGELYVYLPPSARNTNRQAVCSPRNKSCNAMYGWSLGRGRWRWTPGQWQRIAQKVTLNDIGKANGSIVTYANGRRVYSARNLIIRLHKEARPRGVMIQSFFGGHTAAWASPRDQSLYLADFSVAVLKTE